MWRCPLPIAAVPAMYMLFLDLQETADGELVVLHDFDLLRAFPNIGPNVAAYQQLAQHGIKPPPASVQVQVGYNRL
jgi:glycerophosphoryl diester phosphodiesterase